jgi:hypothetical protein
MKMSYIITLFAVFIATNCIGQSISRQVIGSAGTDMSSSDASISWTIGEPVIQTYSANDYMIFQGFHIGTFTVQTPDNLNEGFSGFDISLYPNPLDNQLVIEFDELRENSSLVQLFSVKGEMILSKKIPARSLREQIMLNTYNSGTYFLKIIHNNQKQTFTIIKK